MRRQAFLGAVGTFSSGLAGCTRFSGPQAESSPSKSTRSQRTASSTRYSWETSIRHQATAESPPTFSVTLTNDSPDLRTVTYGSRLLWSEGTFSPNGLAVEPVWADDSEYHPTEPIDGACWQYAEDSPHHPIPLVVKSSELDPGETITESYEIYNDPATEPCYPAGDYEFGCEGIEFEGIDKPLTLAVDISTTFDGSVTVRPHPKTIHPA